MSVNGALSVSRIGGALVDAGWPIDLSPALLVESAQLLDASAIGGILNGRGGHDHGVFVVVGVVALADPEPLEAVLLVEGKRGGVGDTALERQRGHPLVRREIEGGQEQEFADA